MLILGVDNIPFHDPSFDRFLPSSKVFGFKQDIPNPYTLYAKSEKQEELSKKQGIIADYTFQRLKAFFIGLLAKHQKIKLQQSYAKSQLELYKALEAFFKGQLEAGKSVYWRFSEVDVDRSLVEKTLNDLESDLIDTEEDFIRLVGEVPELTPPEVTFASWDGKPVTLYPIRVVSKDIDTAEKEIEIADAAYGPNFGVNALYKQRESGKNFSGDDWFSIQVGVSVPLWYEFKQRPRLRAAYAQKNSAKFTYDNTFRTWQQKLKAMESKIDATVRNIEVFRKKDKALKEMIEAVKRNYESGESDLNIVLEAQLNRLKVQSELAEQEAMYITLVADYQSHIHVRENDQKNESL